MLKKKCQICGKPFFILPHRIKSAKYCSNVCRHKGHENPIIKKECEYCGKEFAAGGGRSQAKQSQKFCSRSCQGYARKRMPISNDLSQGQAAYIAGIIDGEGSIIFLHKNKKRPTIRLTVPNTSKALIDWLKRKTGTGSIIEKTGRKQNHSKQFIWSCYSQNAKKILEQCLPYLVVKKKLAEKAIKTFNFTRV